MNKLTGLVLCGGESRRMGRDKGLLLKDDTPWALHMAAKLAPWPIPITFSINPSQEPAYSAIIPSSQLVIDSPGLNIVFGPLRGLLSVHQQFPDQDILLLACDMLDLEEETLRRLIDLYEGTESDQFFAYRQGDLFQPFCGIYTTAGLARPHTLALEGRLTDYSLQSMLKKGRTVSLPVMEKDSFKNYNTL